MINMNNREKNYFNPFYRIWPNHPLGTYSKIDLVDGLLIPSFTVSEKNYSHKLTKKFSIYQNTYFMVHMDICRKKSIYSYLHQLQVKHGCSKQFIGNYLTTI